MKKTLNRELKLFEVAESESFGGKSRVMSLVSFLLGAEGGEGFPFSPFVLSGELQIRDGGLAPVARRLKSEERGGFLIKASF